MKPWYEAFRLRSMWLNFALRTEAPGKFFAKIHLNRGTVFLIIG